MAWIKYTACYKHGNGQPEWIDVGDATPNLIEDIFREHDREYGDPEGFRTGKYEVSDLPPVTVLEHEVKRIVQSIEANQAYLLELRKMLARAS